MYAHVLVATDGSPQSNHAIDAATALALCLEAELTVLHGVEHPDLERLHEDLEDWERIENIELSRQEMVELYGRAIIEAAEERARERGAHNLLTAVQEGPAAEAITDYARKHGTDLIVVGTRGLSNLPGLLMGSVSHQVIREAEVPVLAVR